MPTETYDMRPIGRVRSPLIDPAQAPKQGDEGAPPAEIVLDPEVVAGTTGLRPGDAVLVFTWLHQADRQVLAVHPRGDRTRPVTGVFATRAPHRPNPIGLHRVTIAEIDGAVLTVHGLEAIDGTPVLDLKPVLGPTEER